MEIQKIVNGPLWPYNAHMYAGERKALHLYWFGRGKDKLLISWSRSAHFPDCVMFDIFRNDRQSKMIAEASRRMGVDRTEFTTLLSHARHDNPLHVK